jgi:GNAT superfamily N-acetyltransferase
MPTNFQLRAAVPEDLAFQKQLYATTREDEMNAAQFPPEMREAFVAMQFHAQTTHYTQHYPAAHWSIIECDGVRAGRLIVHRVDDHLNIIDIALMPEFRGRGIGTALLELIFDEARNKRLPVRLFAFTGERAIKLYHRLGFADVRSDGIHTELVWRPGAPSLLT